jgi:anti-sigma B factor antagonist
MICKEAGGRAGAPVAMKLKRWIMNEHSETYEFKLPEHFDSGTPHDIVALLQSLPDSDYRCVTLDLSQTSSMDSSGIGTLVFLYKELTAKGKAFVLRKPQRGVYNLLMETGIDRLFDIEMSSGIIKAGAELSGLDVQLDVVEDMVGDVCVLSLVGMMNYPAGSSQFKKSMFMALTQSNKILLDMSELAFFDSLSVGSILRLGRLLRDNNGGMKICCVNQAVRNVFESLGVDLLIPIYDTREEALADKEF